MRRRFENLEVPEDPFFPSGRTGEKDSHGIFRQPKEPPRTPAGDSGAASAAAEYRSNTASATEIAAHLKQCDAAFVPALSSRREIDAYAQKIVDHAERFEAWAGGTLAGLVAAYCNDRENHRAYITSVSVLEAWKGRGIAAELLKRCIEHATSSGMRCILLEVGSANRPAIKLYEKLGFVAGKATPTLVTMERIIRRSNQP